MLLSAKAGDAANKHSLDKTCLKHRNRQIQDNLHLVRPIAHHYAQQTGLESDDLLQVGCLGLIKAYSRYEEQRGTPFPSFAKPHIRGAILHFLRDRAGLVRLPRALEERAMKMMRNPEGTPLSAADALAVDHYRSKQHWVEFNDDLLDDRPEGIDLIERSEAWGRVNELFRNLEKDDQRALQMVVIDRMNLRQTAQQLDVSALTVQRSVNRGLNTIAKELNAVQPDA